MRSINLDNVQEAQEFDKVTPGGYVCGITAVEDKPDKEYLRLEYDIAEGDFKNYYRNLYNSKGFWGANFIRSYKDKALPFFKAFITAVEKSNKGYKWDNDESKLKRKLVGLVLAEEEYLSKDGEKKTRLYVAKITNVDNIRKGEFEVPALKKLAGSSESSSPIDNLAGFEDASSNDDDVPF